MYVDNAVVIIREHTAARIRSSDAHGDIIVDHHDDGSFNISQEDEASRVERRSMIALTQDEAEALFLVLDTMLHPDDAGSEAAAGVDPDFDDCDGYEIPALRYGTRSFDPS